MAGFFGLFDYTKPGKGVDPDEPQKHPFFHFWELYWRKFSKFIVLNMIYFLILSPIILYLYTSFYSMVVTALNIDASEVATILFQIMMSVAVSIPNWLAYALLALSVLPKGRHGGLTYMLRNYAREELRGCPTFFARAKANFKQGCSSACWTPRVFRQSIKFLSDRGQRIPVCPDCPRRACGASGYVSVRFMLNFVFMRFYSYMLLITL
jgi:hypothetical protein